MEPEQPKLEWKINPAWRTDTTTAICLQMRESQDYGALPILADALQDANCDDEELLSIMRSSDVEKVKAIIITAVILSVETEAAANWMFQFTRDINYDKYDDYKYNSETGEYVNRRQSDTDPHNVYYVIEQGHEAVKGETMYWGSDDGADYFRSGEEQVKEFFRNWSLVTGYRGPMDLSEVRYRCAC